MEGTVDGRNSYNVAASFGFRWVFWQGLGFYSNNPNNEVTYTTIEYAGGQEWGSMSAAANIGLNSDAQLNLEHSTINDSGQHGVYCDEPADATLTRSGNSFNNNAGLDVDC